MKPTCRHVSCASAILLLGGWFAGCSTTQLERSWSAPEVGEIAFNKIMVLAVAPDESFRRAAEDAMQEEVERAEAVTSYSFITEVEELKNRSRVAEAIEQSGADGLVVMRVVSDANEVRYVPDRPMPVPYTSFWGYYSRAYALAPFYWDPGTYRTDRVVGIETNIYEARDESLVWSGFTRSTNPGNVQKLVSEVADAVRRRLREQGLIRE